MDSKGSASDSNFPALSLNDLLAELQSRLTSVLSTRDRERHLLEAVLAVGGDLDLQAVLRRIAEGAATLVDATYAALGVISEDATGLTQFIVVGIDDDVAAEIGHLPQGLGVLGELISEPHPLRLSALAAHPSSFGFPPGHPPMRSFLGVPIRVRDVVFGNLYLTEKRGGGEFDEADEAVVRALAASAGVAIQNARLYSESLERERWLAASSEISTALLSGTDPDEVLASIAACAREVTGGALAFVAIPVDGERLLVEVADGVGAEAVLGTLILRGSSPVGDVHNDGNARHWVPSGEDRTSIAVALGGPEGAGRGVLVVTGLPAAKTSSAFRTVGSFAAQAAVALEIAARRSDAERFAVFEDRDRIARDLHDLVIQRLFATGMQLESAMRLVATHPEEVTGRVHRAVDDLDATIRELRSTIYGLQPPPDGAPAFRALLLRAVDIGAEQLGFTPSLRMEGLLDTRVPSGVSDHLLAALREALSNTARHAHAHAVQVRVAVRGNEVVLTVEDDGIGMSSAGERRSGLANLSTRAGQVDGHLTLVPSQGGGTSLTWSAALPVG